MLDNENQIKAYKALQLHPVTLPYSHGASNVIISAAEAKEAEWEGMTSPTVAYPASMTASLADIAAVIAAIKESSAAANAMLSALSGAETPSEFITLGIGWDVVKKTAANPPATFAINSCISDKTNVDAVSASLNRINGSAVASVMTEINAILTPASAPGDTGAGGAAATPVVPPEKIAELNAAIAPCKAESVILSTASKALKKLADDGAASKQVAVKAFNDAVSIAVINATTGGDGVMNDVMASVVSEEVLEALRG